MSVTLDMEKVNFGKYKILENFRMSAGFISYSICVQRHNYHRNHLKS